MASNNSGEGIDYRAAGVDIAAGDELIDHIGEAVRKSHGPEVLRGLGHFGGFYQIGAVGEQSTLVASIDGVGTKLRVAQLAGIHEHIGFDIVNHCVNDILACGARPLFFLDYYATGKLNPEAAAVIIQGIAAACVEARIALLGGETAEMPGIYHGEDYDLAGVVVGLVDAGQIVDGSAIEAGDIVVGLSSSGFHTNGYSLIRAALGLNSGEREARLRLAQPAPFDPSVTVGEALLRPHRSYSDSVMDSVAAGLVTGMAHITGGGIAGNLSRIVPDGLVANIDPESWDVPPIFDYIAGEGNVSRAECFNVFNMGIGYIIVSRPEHVEKLLNRNGEAKAIGRVEKTSDNMRVQLAGVNES
ncbi:MAG: phosphoribosylformylglycinamidine cyclo-ligase [Chloroflexota bacterium]